MLRTTSDDEQKALESRKEQRFFIRRDKPCEVFWKHHQELSAEMAAIPPGETMKTDIHVLNFYGIGGVGKTTLRNTLLRELTERGPSPAVSYDFDIKRNKNATDLRGTLTALRRAIPPACKKCGMDDFVFPLFDLALFYYKYKLGLAISDDDPAAVRSWLEEHPVLDQVVDIISLFFPFVNAAHVIDKGSTAIRRRVQAQKAELTHISSCEPPELLQKLPYYFSLDLKDNMKNCKKPLVIFLDTYEALVNPLSDKATYKSDDEWLRGLPEGLIVNVPGVLWVILGRNRLTWDEIDAAWNDTLEPYVLDCFNEADCVRFLTRSGVSSEALCIQLAQLTGGLPLYLDLSMDIYDRLIVQGQVPTIGHFGTDRKKLVEMLLRYMSRTHADLVYRLSCLDSWDKALLKAVFDSAQLLTYDVVKDLSFIACEDGNYSMHSVVRDILFSNCPAETRAEIWEKAEGYYGRLLAGLAPTDERYAAIFSAFARYGIDRQVTPEALKSFCEEKLDGSLIQLLRLCKTAPIFQCVQRLLNHPAACTPLLEQTHILLSQAYRAAGQYRQALEAGQMAVELSRANLGEDDPTTLSAMNNLSTSYSVLGRPLEALALLEKVLERRSAILGEDHTDTLSAMNNLAISYSDLGRYQDALALLEKLLERRSALFGEDHPETLFVMSNLATAYFDLNRYQEALELREKVLERCTVLMGEEHPDTLAAMENLAISYFSLDRSRETLLLFERVLESRTVILGEDHPNTLLTMNNLAFVYSQLGRHQEALKLQEKALERAAALLGEDHPNTLQAMANLAVLYNALGQAKEAEALEKKYNSLCGEPL